MSEKKDRENEEAKAVEVDRFRSAVREGLSRVASVDEADRLYGITVAATIRRLTETALAWKVGLLIAEMAEVYAEERAIRYPEARPYVDRLEVTPARVASLRRANLERDR